MIINIKKQKISLILGILFLIVLGIRLFFAFQTPTFTGDHAYFSLRQVENIKDHWLPIYADELSYSGKTNLFMPLFYYIIAALSPFVTIEFAGKILPNIFSASLVFIVYLLAFELTKNERASLFSAFVSGFIPIFIGKTTNTFSEYSLIFPLMFYMIYCFIKIEDTAYVYRFLISLLILTMMTPTVLMIIISLLIYLVLIKLENIKQSRIEMEVILFSAFFVVWMLFLIFKKAFMVHGPAIIWGNIPLELISQRFSEITITGAIYQVGFIPLMYGMYALFSNIFKKKQKNTYLLVAFAFTSAIMLWLKVIEKQIGLIAIGIVFSIFFAQFIHDGSKYLQKTKFAKIEKLFFIFLLILFIFTSVAPSILIAKTSIEQSVPEAEIEGLEWIQNHTSEDSVILAVLNDGNKVTAIAKRKNVIDTNFILQNDVQERLNDVEYIYRTQFATEALSILDKYSIDYIYFSPTAQKEYSKNNFEFIEYGRCFKNVLNTSVIIYQVRCRLNE